MVVIVVAAGIGTAWAGYGLFAVLTGTLVRRTAEEEHAGSELLETNY
jgi:hypothetical protein